MHWGIFWEFFNLSMIFILFIVCLKKYGKWTTIKIFGIGMFYGMVLENGGPAIVESVGFEGYFWEETYQLYLFEFFGYGIRISMVPLATHLGWSTVFLVAYVFYEQIADTFPSLKDGSAKSMVYGFLIMTGSGLLQDLHLDPLATRFRWWVWNTNHKPLWFGVPLINYIAWFWAVGTFGAGWIYVHYNEKNKDLNEKEQALLLFKLLPVFWVFDTICVMATKAFCNLLGLIYIVPKANSVFEWISLILVVAALIYLLVRKIIILNNEKKAKIEMAVVK